MRNPTFGYVEDVIEWLRDQIDGGDECRGRDTEISEHIRTLEAARDLMKLIGAHAFAWDGVDKKTKRPYGGNEIGTCHVSEMRRARSLTSHWASNISGSHARND